MIVRRKKRKEKIRARVRAKVFGLAERPRLSVFRSNKHIYAQLIDDVSGQTLCEASDLEIKSKKGVKTEISKDVGKLIAKKALKIKKERVAFDRGGYNYHGRIKALAEGARAEGLKF